MTKLSEKLYTINEEDIEAFYREGYFIARCFLSEESVERINQAYADKLEASKDNKQWLNLSFSEDIQSELINERVTAIMEALLDGPIKLWLGMYAVVMPGGEGLAWHQDNQYTHILGHMCNAFVALDNIDVNKAGLWIAPRSHRLGRQPNLNKEGESHRRAAGPDNAEAVPPMQPGDAVIFHRELLHHSKVNHTDTPRRAFAFQVSSASCRFAETGKRVEPKL